VEQVVLFGESRAMID